MVVRIKQCVLLTQREFLPGSTGWSGTPGVQNRLDPQGMSGNRCQAAGITTTADYFFAGLQMLLRFC